MRQVMGQRSINLKIENMKNLVICTLILLSVSVNAQRPRMAARHDMKHEMNADFTPEQKADLISKKMTIALDLSNTQQIEMYAFHLKKVSERPAKPKTERKELTNDQLYELKSKHLDALISEKKEIKNILTPEQFKKWERSRKERINNRPRGKKHRGQH